MTELSEVVQASPTLPAKAWQKKDVDVFLDAMEEFAVRLADVIKDSTIDVRGYDLQFQLVKVPKRCSAI